MTIILDKTVVWIQKKSGLKGFRPSDRIEVAMMTACYRVTATLSIVSVPVVPGTKRP